MKVTAVIPARYGSSRLPGKPLLDILGKPMICRVYEKACQAAKLAHVIVATDDSRIADAVASMGGTVCMTSPLCASGTDRLLEVADMYPADAYINIQGDEPLIDPAAVDRLIECMEAGDHPWVATLAYRLTSDAFSRVKDPNLVKVVVDSASNALYFSRSPLPFVRDPDTECSYLAHIGVYAYTREALAAFRRLPPSPLEQIEKLEQLRFLQAGIKIKVLETKDFGPGVDTLEDLERVRRIFAGVPQKLSLQERLGKIRLIISDVDGVLTDGSLYYGADGECLKCFNAKDGLGVGLAKEAGIEVALLSGRDCPSLRRRIQDLGIRVVRLGRLAKAEAVGEILAECGRTKEEAVFLGDDVPDIAGFESCALGVAVADAMKEVRERADLVLTSSGGRGALRELIDRIRECR